MTNPQQKRTKRAATTGILLTGAFFLALGIAAGATAITPESGDDAGWTTSAEDTDDSMGCVDIYEDFPYVGVAFNKCMPPP
jgi:hypothetical protein